MRGAPKMARTSRGPDTEYYRNSDSLVGSFAAWAFRSRISVPRVIRLTANIFTRLSPHSTFTICSPPAGPEITLRIVRAGMVTRRRTPLMISIASAEFLSLKSLSR